MKTTYHPARIRADHAAALDRIGAGMVAAVAELEPGVAPVVSRQSLVDAAIAAWVDRYERRQEKAGQ